MLNARPPPVCPGEDVQPIRPQASVDPAREYELRRQDRLRHAAHHARRERLVGNGRVLVFLAALALACLSFGLHLFHPLWVLPTALLFVVLLFVHEGVVRAWYRADRAVAYYTA